MEKSAEIPKKMAICVTFHFVESRLSYLRQISDHFRDLAEEVFLTVVTNTDDKYELNQIDSTVGNKGIKHQTFTPVGLGHPFLLPWSHLYIFRKLSGDDSFSHFLYLEDDTKITRENVLYWVEAREILRQFNLVPAFLRVEKKNGYDDWYSSDCTKLSCLAQLPKARVSDNLLFFNLPYPYQGMYLLDRELMAEHLSGDQSHPDKPWAGVRENATQGLIFVNVPKGFSFRTVLPYKINERRIDERCFIHHMPNNYANQEPRTNLLGSLPVNTIVY